MVSNAESIIQTGVVPQVGSIEDREWSAMLADFVQNKDTAAFTDKFTVAADGDLSTNDLSLFQSSDCAITTISQLSATAE